jgi:ferredoxin
VVATVQGTKAEPSALTAPNWMTIMWVTVDAESCAGFGNCAVVCPGVFAVDPQLSRSMLLVPGDVPAGLEQQALAAAGECPTNAITVEAG